MERNGIFQYIQLDDHSATPKYQQLANSIINAIEAGKGNTHTVCEPKDLIITAGVLAQARSKSLAEIATLTTTNAHRLFRFD